MKRLLNLGASPEVDYPLFSWVAPNISGVCQRQGESPGGINSAREAAWWMMMMIINVRVVYRDQHH